jgi:hypothetical protein
VIALERTGLLLKSDPKLPSLTTLVAGEPVRGSWWGHPRAHEIYAEAVRLSGHPDVLLVKLVAGKDTFVHRRLWSHVYAIATAGESWQSKKLSAEAQELLRRVSREQSVETSGKPAKELETRLLAHGEQFHAAGGEHRKHLETWEHWSGCTGFVPAPIPVAEAKRILEAALPGAAFPWLQPY